MKMKGQMDKYFMVVDAEYEAKVKAIALTYKMAEIDDTTKRQNVKVGIDAADYKKQVMEK